MLMRDREYTIKTAFGNVSRKYFGLASFRPKMVFVEMVGEDGKQVGCK